MKDLTIVQAEKKDAEALLKYRNAIGVESDNLTFGREGSGTTLEAQEAFIQKTRKDEGSVIYVGKIDGEIVALGSITAYDKPRIRHRGELGLTVRKPYWNQGIATKMMQALMGFAKAVRSLSWRSGPITRPLSTFMRSLVLEPSVSMKNSLKSENNTPQPI